MCGIAGIFLKDGGKPSQLRPTLECMLDLMAHRGPDDRGAEEFPAALLGHLRLSILDLSPAGHQPMFSPDGEQAIIYNGEVYNYLELKRELAAQGEVFRSSCDTEVILAAYRRWGLDCFRRFNGMWALAIWDRPKNSLVLCRDRVGVKPLYWSPCGGRLAFASEIKAVAAYRQLQGLPLEYCRESMQTYLSQGLVDGLEETFYRDIYRFKPGHLMVLVPGRGIRHYTSWWDLPAIAKGRKEELAQAGQAALAEELSQTLADAVAVHTRSDVPVGVCLSGGLDSSAVAGGAAGAIPGLKTFTAWYEEGGEYNELEHADQVNQAFGLASYKTVVDGPGLLDKMPQLLWYLDEPTLAMGVYPQWHVMEAAAREVTVVMDGQGGDEIFAGYDFYAARYLYGQLLKHGAKAYQRTLAGYKENYGLARADQLGQEVKQLFMGNAVGRVARAFDGHLDSFLFQELTTTRLPALLRYEDRLSMAFSIESRVPLLDHRLIELAFALPEEMKIGPGWSKYGLRLAVEGWLPGPIAWRKDKKGFPTPFEVWADGQHKEAIRGMLLGGSLPQMIGLKTLENFFAGWDAGRRDHWLLWRMLSLQLWLAGYQARLNREIAINDLGAGFRRPAELFGQVAAPPPVEVIVTVDYETFDTNDFVLDANLKVDWDATVIEPTNALAEALEEHGAKLTVLWDTAEYFWLKDNGGAETAARLEEQLKDLVRRGHDVQLHLHPAWPGVRRAGEVWLWPEPGKTAPNMGAGAFAELLGRSVETMEALFRPIRPDYRVRGFRGRGYEVDPFRAIGRELMAKGILADSSRHGQGPIPSRGEDLSPAASPMQADFLEYPIYALGNARWDFSGPPAFATMPLETLPKGTAPAPHPGPALVLIGHCKQAMHLQELSRCLSELPNLLGGRLRFVTWQESIEARLPHLHGAWQGGGGLNPAYFEDRWEEADPFKSQQVNDPFYRLLLDMLPARAESLLDLGCAEGDFTMAMATALGAGRVAGVDVAAGAVRRARQNHPTAEFHNGDLANFRLSERFEVLVSSQNLYYFTSAERQVMLAHWESMLAGNGRLLAAWWTGAKRGKDEELIERDLTRFFRVEREETYHAPAGAAVSGQHRLLLLKRRTSPAEEEVLGGIYWKDKRVAVAGQEAERLKPRYGHQAKQWGPPRQDSGAEASADVLICDPDHLADVAVLRPWGTLVVLGRHENSEAELTRAGILWARRGPGIAAGALVGPGIARAAQQALDRQDPAAAPPRPATPPPASPQAAPAPPATSAGMEWNTWKVRSDDRVLIFLNEEADFEGLYQGIKRATPHCRLTSIHKPVLEFLKARGADCLDPRDLGQHFYRQKLGWTVWYPDQREYHRKYHELAAPVIDNPEIRYFENADLFYHGDYNQAHGAGLHLLQLVDLLVALLEDFRPTAVLVMASEVDQDFRLMMDALNDLGRERGFRVKSVAQWKA